MLLVGNVTAGAFSVGQHVVHNRQDFPGFLQILMYFRAKGMGDMVSVYLPPDYWVKTEYFNQRILECIW